MWCDQTFLALKVFHNLAHLESLVKTKLSKLLFFIWTKLTKKTLVRTKAIQTFDFLG